MFIKTMAARGMFVAAAISAFATSANAFVLGFDPQIVINRAIDSPTLTVRYTGASATLVELRINGVSVGTRTVAGVKDSGETNFTISLGDLHGGDNEVEIRLFDRTGKLVGKDHTNIATASAQSGPVFISSPKTGDTVRGQVNVGLGFDHDLKDAYVSFFVDGTFKRMTNVPPFEYAWDTETETNGWHELEGWAIDDTSNTHKSGKIRVFVNNPGGQTPREGVARVVDLSPITNTSTVILTGAAKTAHKVVKTGKHAVRAAGDLRPLPAATPGVYQEEVLSPAAQAKQIKVASGIVMGPRSLTPTGTREKKIAKPIVKVAVAETKVAVVETHEHPSVIEITKHVDKPEVVAFRTHVTKQVGSVISNVSESANLVRITKGSRLPNLSTFEIALDSSYVDFHGVLPRVDEGIPMTPLRFLLEKRGGLVNWNNPSKTVFAKADGNDLSLRIGDSMAFLNQNGVKLEKASYLDHGRTVVPLSFMDKVLHVKIDYDKSSHHMLITSDKK